MRTPQFYRLAKAFPAVARLTLWNQEKATEAILYLAERMAVPTIIEMCKVISAADMMHKERLGSFMTEDSYVSVTDVGGLRLLPLWTFALIEKAAEGGVDAFTVEKRLILPRRKANMMAFGQSDILCLSEALAQYHEQAQVEAD